MPWPPSFLPLALETKSSKMRLAGETTACEMFMFDTVECGRCNVQHCRHLEIWSPLMLQPTVHCAAQC